MSNEKPADFTAESDPHALFERWFAEASDREINDPNAMSLASVDADGMPDLRVVLLKGRDRDGFVFYTNLDSAKGRQLLGSGKAAICFHWKSLRRQVRARGPVEPVTDQEADLYYASRPRGSRIGAWASRQSQPLKDRAELEGAVAAVEERFAGEDPTRPPNWSGFRLRPVAIEFWQDGASRLHDRVLFKAAPNGEWTSQRLFP